MTTNGPLVAENSDGRLSTPRSLVQLAHVIYSLHAVAVVIGVVACIDAIEAKHVSLGSISFALPLMIAIALDYMRRGDARGTFLAAHFDWQIRTVWLSLVLGLVGFVVGFFVLAGIFMAKLLPLILMSIWIAYRVIRGWVSLNDGRAIARKS